MDAPTVMTGMQKSNASKFKNIKSAIFPNPCIKGLSGFKNFMIHFLSVKKIFP